ncbi:MAG: pseudoazurin [Rhodobacterales bacterium]|nr:MAG: pseudoazurin [Rhodobacterales bacterium]
MGAAAAATTVLPTALRAEGPVTHEVQMLNKHPDDKKQKNVFLPAVLKINPGDTVKFVAVDKGHNSVSYKDMIPEGAEGWKSKLNKDFEVTLDVEGAYGYFCQPHKSLGMVGLILVGDVSGNYEAIKEVKQRGKAKKVMKKLFEEADAMLAE